MCVSDGVGGGARSIRFESFFALGGCLKIAMPMTSRQHPIVRTHCKCLFGSFLPNEKTIFM